MTPPHSREERHEVPAKSFEDLNDGDSENIAEGKGEKSKKSSAAERESLSERAFARAIILRPDRPLPM